MIDEQRLHAFIRESNHIEGIEREPTFDEVAVARAFLNPSKTSVEDLIMAVDVFEPSAKLRDKVGMGVRVGNHIAPPGGPEIRKRLEKIVATAVLATCARPVLDEPYSVHCAFMSLHPFTDGNGRSGRLLWLWMMVKQDGVMPPLGFLHTFYYMTLAASDD